MESTDTQLLDQHRRGEPDAFARLVRRHINWVYSAARRKTADAHLAEDITQAVFIVLAQSPPTRLNSAALSPWLFGVLIRTCKTTLRAEAIRRRHESEAAKMRPTTTDPQADWDSIAPNLEDAVAKLRFADQQAILLRFYEQLSFAEVGAMLGITEEAARKRVSRATEKLRGVLSCRGLNVPAVALSAALDAESVTPAPVAVAEAIAKNAVGAITSGAAALTQGVVTVMIWTKTKIAVAAAIAAIFLIAGTGAILKIGAAPSGASNATTPPSQIQPPQEIIAGTADAEYVVGGFVKRSGVYSLNARGVSVLSAIVAAGPENDRMEDVAVDLIRRDDRTAISKLYDRMPLSTLASGQMFPNGPNILVMPDDEISLVRSEPHGGPSLIWGRTREGAVALSGTSKRSFDLDLGVAVNVPEELLPAEIQADDEVQRDLQFAEWSIKMGIDLIGQEEGTDLVLVNTVFDRPDDGWDSISPQGARERLSSRVTPPKGNKAYLSSLSNGAWLCIVRTRGGSLVRIEGIGKTPDGAFARFRYSLAEPLPTTAPSTTEPL